MAEWTAIEARHDGIARCVSCGVLTDPDEHGCCPDCTDGLEECVWCGERQPPEAFEDGLRCRLCAEEQGDG